MAHIIDDDAEVTLDLAASGLAGTEIVQPGYLAITGALVGLLQYNFSAAAQIEFLALKDRVWVAGETTPVTITSLGTWNPKNSAQRPALLVDRLDQDLDLAHRVIGDQFQGIAPGNFNHYLVGQHVVHCLGGREGEAELLAAQVFRNLTKFGPVIRDQLCLTRFLATKIGKRIQLDEAKEHYSVPVLCAYAYAETWRMTPIDEAEVTRVRAAITFPVIPGAAS